MTNTFVLVHGAWHGAWCFERLVVDSDHSPFLSQPGELAELLVRGRVTDPVG
jgi:hypothetical protein